MCRGADVEGCRKGWEMYSVLLTTNINSDSHPLTYRPMYLQINEAYNGFYIYDATSASPAWRCQRPLIGSISHSAYCPAIQIWLQLLAPQYVHTQSPTITSANCPFAICSATSSLESFPYWNVPLVETYCTTCRCMIFPLLKVGPCRTASFRAQ